jgi:hypothetical protein
MHRWQEQVSQQRAKIVSLASPICLYQIDMYDNCNMSHILECVIYNDYIPLMTRIMRNKSMSYYIENYMEHVSDMESQQDYIYYLMINSTAVYITDYNEAMQTYLNPSTLLCSTYHTYRQHLLCNVGSHFLKQYLINAEHILETLTRISNCTGDYTPLLCKLCKTKCYCMEFYKTRVRNMLNETGRITKTRLKYYRTRSAAGAHYTDATNSDFLRDKGAIRHLEKIKIRYDVHNETAISCNESAVY